MSAYPIKPGQPGYGQLLAGILNPQAAPNLNTLGGPLRTQFAPGAQATAKPKFLQEGGMGRHIAGAIGDMLLQQAGMQPVYAPVMRDRQQAEAEDVQWQRHREADNEDWQSREAWKLANPDPAPMVRDAMAWQQMTPEQRAAYEAMKKAQEGDPIVNTSLPNGQFYSGPRSGLAQALAGGQAAPSAPVGRLTPIAGGAGGNASGGFPY